MAEGFYSVLLYPVLPYLAIVPWRPTLSEGKQRGRRSREREVGGFGRVEAGKTEGCIV